MRKNIMDRKVIYIVFVAFIIVNIGTINGFTCQNTTHCSCYEESFENYNIICSSDSLIKKKHSSSIAKPAFFNITINFYKSLKIECINSPDWSNFELDNLNVMKTLEFSQCVPPGPQDSQRVANILGSYDRLFINFDHATSIPFIEKLNWMAGNVDFIEVSLKFTKDSNNINSDIFQGLNSFRTFEWIYPYLHKLPFNLFNNAIQYKMLALSNNHLKTIDTGTFDNLSDILNLDLSNNEIEDLQLNIFHNLTNLQNLELQSNNIRMLHPDIFRDLKNLASINLNDNNFISLPQGLFRTNTKLQSVELESNKNLTELPDNLFDNVIWLELMFLANNGLTKLNDNMFRKMIKLRNLNINGNYLRKLPDHIFDNLYNLLHLNLSSNLLEDLPDNVFHDTNNLVSIDLSKNYLTSIKENTFMGLNYLNELYLSNNKLSYIHIDAFKYFKELNVVYLNNNYLKLLEPYKTIKRNNMGIKFYDYPPNSTNISPFYNCSNLEELYLSHNNITEIKRDWNKYHKNLKVLDLSYNALNTLTEKDLQFLSNYVEINLSYNNITSIYLDTITENVNKNLSTVQHVLVNLNENPIKCDCEIYNFWRYISNIHFSFQSTTTFSYDNLKCHTPNSLAGLPVHNLTENLILCRFKSLIAFPGDHNSPTNGTCDCISRPHDQALLIDCSDRNLTKAPEQINFQGFLKVELNLSLNKLKEPPSMDKIGYDKVTYLNLSNNYINFIDEKLISPNLKILNLDSNMLTEMDYKIFERISPNNNNTKYTNMTKLSLAKNPWPCDCRSRDLFNFIHANKQIMKELVQVNCIDDLQKQRSFVNMTLDELCPTSNLLMILILALINLSVFVIVFLFFRYKKQIQIWLYSKNFCLCLITEDDLDKDKIYDAFISYSHKDEEFVNCELVKRLEEEGPRPYTICIHSRDWLAGEWIPTQIENSVSESRRTIIVLSRNFIESDWSKFEFLTAHKLALKEKRTRVIVILLGDIGPLKNLDKDLRAYLETNTYIKWGDPWFWRKLKFAMPHHQRFHKSEQIKLEKNCRI